MATYVNDLRLKEIATGDESGTWGDTTNTNLELIAEAFSYGTEAITTNADTHTTTIADGASDPGRSMYLKYTGTLDSACTITIGPNTVSKMWFIENATSGSQNIIISQGSGANITIPAGDVKVIYSDGAGSGAAVVDAFASLNVVDLKVQDDLTVTDDMTVGGTLGVTGVLTATSLDISGDIDVDGTTNLDVVDIDGAVDMATTLAVAGNVDFNGDLDVDGTTNLDVVDIDGAVDMASTLTVAGVLTGASLDISGDIDVDGTTNLDVVDIDGAVDMASTLGVTGVVTANAGVVVDNITIDGNEIDVGSGNMTLDSAGEIILDASDGIIRLKDDDTEFGKISQNSNNLRFFSSISDADILFQGNDGGSSITALTLDMSAAGAATFNSDITAVNALFKEGNSGAAATSGSANNLVLENSSNAGLTIATPANGIASIFYSDPDSNAAGYVQYNHSTNLHTIFSTGDIALDAGNDTISLKDSGTQFGEFISSSTDFVIKSSVSDKDIIFKGNDGGSAITALTLDMSDAGRATFNNKASFNNPIAVGQSTFSGGSVLADFHGSGSGVGAQLAFANDHNTSKFFVGIEGNTSGDGFLYQQQNADINFYTNNTLHAKLHNDGAFVTTPTAGGHAVFNENSVDADFRVESNGKTHMLFVDGGNNRVGIMNSAPATSLHIGDSSGSQQIRLESNGGGVSIKGTDTVNNASSGYTVGHLNGTNRYELTLGTIPIFDMYKTEVIFNEGSVDMDFRVESNGNANMLFVDGGNDFVSIGTATNYASTFNVGGATALNRGTGGATTASGATLSIQGTGNFNSDYFGTDRATVAIRSNEPSNDGWNPTLHITTIRQSLGTNQNATGGIGFTTIDDSNATGIDDAARIQVINMAASSTTSGTGLVFYNNVGGSKTQTAQTAFKLAPTEAVFNEDSNDIDFRVESNGNANMLLVDGGSDFVAFGNTVANPASGFAATGGVGYSSGGGMQIANNSSGASLVLGQNFSTNGSICDFRKQSTIVGTISVTGSATAYNTSSDARLKDVTGKARGLEVINKLNPVAYNWKADGKADEGLIAQKVLNIVPNAVSGSEKDMYQMDYSKLVVHLVAGMKEQQEQIDALQSEINLLKGE